MTIVKVTFNWDDGKGICYDCGNPAAYCVPDMYGVDRELTNFNLMCPVCAAHHASTGERIVYIWAEDEDSDETKRISDHYAVKTIHLLTTRGQTQCENEGQATPEINEVTCEDCIAQHDEICERVERELGDIQ